MPEFKFTVTINEKDKPEAERAMTALLEIKKRVETDDLVALSEVIIKDPFLVKQALAYLSK